MTYAPEVRDRAYVLYLDLGSLRKAHHALRDELRQKGHKAPTFRVFCDWSKRDAWRDRKASMVRKVSEATQETLVERRKVLVGKLKRINDDALDAISEAPAALEPRDVPRFVDLEDRLRGGGVKVEVDVTVAEEARRRLRALFPLQGEEDKG